MHAAVRAGLAEEHCTSPAVYEPATRVVEPWKANVTALLDGRPLKWRDLVAEGTPLPTPWPKAAFEERQRGFQARRRQTRAGNRPEREMNDPFREEQADTSRLLGSDRHAHTVGAFQGANDAAPAICHPQLECVTFARDEAPFCRVGQPSLDGGIDLYAGPPRTE